MQHIPTLISDLAVILICAGVVSILFKWLKQPVVLGYIMAGVLAGPSVNLMPAVADAESIRTWAEIGVIFLLFALGLDFSFKKLSKVGGTAISATTIIVVGMMSLGYLTGIMLGWGKMDSIFLGGMISISSTTIIFKAFNDMGLSKHRFAGVVLGVLIVEDLFAILLMVLLSTLAATKHIEGGELLNSVIQLAVFMLFSFIMGIFLLPTLLKKWRKHLNDETLLIVSLGLCLGLVIIATKIGFSAALGAFVMGSILAETIEAERIERVVRPVKDLFAAIFFVSIGMLIDLPLLWEYKVPIIILTIVVMLGQLFFSTLGILISGQPLKVAIQSGLSLMQIGEFAFIIASLGIALGVTAPFLYPIVVAVSVITTFFTPYMIRLSTPAYSFVSAKLPMRWQELIENYSSGSNTINQRSTWHKLLRGLLRTIGTYMSVCIVLIYVWVVVVDPLIESKIHGLSGDILSLVVILLIISPMLRAIIVKKNRSAEFKEIWNIGGYNRSSLIILTTLRTMISIGIIMWLISHLLHTSIGVLPAIAAATIAIMFFYKQFKIPAQLEKRFFKNLSARDVEMERSSPVTQRVANNLLKRDIHLAEFEVSQMSPCIGKTLKELHFRKECNVNIVAIVRGESHINIPGGDERIYPFDKLVVVGGDSDLSNFIKYIEAQHTNTNINTERSNINLEQFRIKEGSELIGLNIIESGIRDRAQCLVIGIERGETSISNPIPTTIFELGDVVWIVGEHEKVVYFSDGHRMK